ncbi:MAG TPA: acylphosphatase [Caldilineaceae bacterium]|mgnify:CR=1 FL=1|nr:acylphosphatase [Caldilineaceae bacterium]
MKRLAATVHGIVQGVSFREYTRREATRLGLTGWVANEFDGTVIVVAEGAEATLNSLLRWLHRGSPSARVDQVDASWLPATGEFYGFDIRW